MPRDLVDGRRTRAARAVWVRWFRALRVDQHHAMPSVWVEQCLLPRGTASDNGWLSTD